MEKIQWGPDRLIHFDFAQMSQKERGQMEQKDLYRAIGIYRDETEFLKFSNDYLKGDWIRLAKTRFEFERNQLSASIEVFETDNIFVQAELIFHRGLSSFYRKDLDRASLFFKRARDLFKREGDLFRYCLSYVNQILSSQSVHRMQSEEVKTLESFIHLHRVGGVLCYVDLARAFEFLSQRKYELAYELVCRARAEIERYYDWNEQLFSQSFLVVLELLLEKSVQMDLFYQFLDRGPNSEIKEKYLRVVEKLSQGIYPKEIKETGLSQLQLELYPLFQKKKPLTEKLVLLLEKSSLSRDELVSQLWPSEVINESHFKRLKVLISKTRKTGVPLSYSGGRYFLVDQDLD